MEPKSNEWRGVTQVVNKTQNGLYYANATTVVMAAMLVVTFVITNLNGDGGGGVSNTIVFFILALPIVWVLSYFMGTGEGELITGYSSPTISPDSHIQSRIPIGNEAPFETKDFDLGRIAVSEKGISGFILIPWQDVRGVKAKDTLNVELSRRARFFGLPIGTHKILLNFQTTEDARRFETAVKQHIFQ